MKRDQTFAKPGAQARMKLIVALDVAAADHALRLARQLRGHVGLFKIGPELFTAEGPVLVRKFVDQGVGVFLDLKLHDIPNTVRGAARSAARLGVKMITVHASGGAAMMQAAIEGAGEGAISTAPPRVLGVSVLTSLSNADLAAMGWIETAGAAAMRLACLAQESGLCGVVASPHEAATIRQKCGGGFAIVTPGIRPAAAARDDQARAGTPEAAIRAGADYLVVGRPVTQSADPAAAAEAITEEIAGVLSNVAAETIAHG
jgi:orotidine-5'-phosphate decarboxylase